MPSKRRALKARVGRITKADAEAFIAGEGLALHRALGLKPWQFTTSATARRAQSAEEIMANREQVEAELLDWERR